MRRLLLRLTSTIMLIVTSLVSVALVSGCNGGDTRLPNMSLRTSNTTTDNEVALYPIAITVYPGTATVSLTAQGSGLIAVLEQTGPTATFDLPAGDYTYEARARSHQTFQGSFSLPQNRHLEVWMTPR
ncbi:MAG: hypothetical protein AAF708_03655 [Deinococcota bacterium]